MVVAGRGSCNSVAVAAPAAGAITTGRRGRRGRRQDGGAGRGHGLPGPAKGLDTLPATSPGALPLTNVYNGQPAAATITAPLVAFAVATAALMAWTVGTRDPAGAGTRGQNFRHCAEQVECPGVSAVSK
jgi:hypothetical protein